MLTEDAILVSGWEGIDANLAPPEIVRRLRKLIEIQRSMTADGKHWVGGFVEHTVVTPDSVSQRILHRWSEDRIGDLIRPAPIDWDAWTAEHVAAATVRNLEVMQ
jgi:hypothetical protein